MIWWMVYHPVRCLVSAELIGKHRVWVKHCPSSGIVLSSFVGVFHQSSKRQTPRAGLKTETSAFYSATGKDSITKKERQQNILFEMTFRKIPNTVILDSYL